ncbi:MAG: GTP diphosphokinase [Chromatiales bacterium]|jgi:GTP pyrophosphokinase|nr:GTP diphosphokinase [Chromatiales bacterium]
MVSVRDSRIGITSKDSLSVDGWLEGIGRSYSVQEMQVIRSACDLALKAHAAQQRASGEPYFQHVLAVANILAELHLDYETLAAAILHDIAEDTGVSQDELRQQFGIEISRLVDGVTKMKLIRSYKSLPERDKQERVQAENLRKMLLAMAEDVRVVLIKLADRTHNMRTLSALPPDKRQRIARETLDIYAPLANRLGIWQLKWELEDLSLRYLDPDAYSSIARLLDDRRVDRDRQVEEFIALLRSALERAGVHATLSGRSKHIYSIWKKMERKNLAYHEIYDVRGVRVLVDDVQDCYKALGAIHGTWQYVAGEFDDYIATPKQNGYRSIHTAVIGPQGRAFEVQIRTHAMHEFNEIGVAAHWRYKEGGKGDDALNRKVAWLRQLLEWKDEIADAGEFVDRFRNEVFEDRIYVFTPKGKVIDLTHGATPLDFAYHVHTEIGHRCRGAKVNGRMVPLTYELQTGQQIEILTVKEGGPSRDWLNPHLGYLRTTRARGKAQHWFRQQDRDKTIISGRAVLERELKRLGLSNLSYERLASDLGYSSPDDLFVAVSHSEIKSSRYLQVAQVLVEPRSMPAGRRGQRTSADNALTVQGVGSVLTHLAHCCRPVPGDEIRGYITVGRGVSVHRGDCPNILRYATRSPERIIVVEWGTHAEQTFSVEVEIRAFDRKGLLSDVTATLANEKINLTAISTRSNSRDHTAHMRLTVEIPDIDVLSRVLTKISQLPNVMRVRRVLH